MKNAKKKVIIASGLSNTHLYLTIIGNAVIQKKRDEYGNLVVIKADVEFKTMFVSIIHLNGEKEDVDKRNLISNAIVDLTFEGDRWEGDVLDGEPFGWGCLYDGNNYVVYEGFIYQNKYVCFGTEYHKNSTSIRYTGMFYNGIWTGYGKLYDRNGDLIGMGGWIRNKRVNYSLHTVPFCEDKSLIHSLLQVLVISNGSFNNPSITRISFRFYPYLRKLVIGSNCCHYVDNCTILGMRKLRSLLIGSSSFLNLKNSSTSFVCKKCPLLSSIIIKKQSFSFYSQFTLSQLKSLRQLSLVESNFINSSFIIESLPSLSTVTLGPRCFFYSLETCLIHLPCLEAIHLGEHALQGTLNERKSCLSMIDLPSLKCVYSDGNSFLYQYQVILQDIPQITDIHLPNAFQKVRKLSITNAGEFEKKVTPINSCCIL